MGKAHIMLDLETMGFPPDGAICSLAAVNILTEDFFEATINWPDSVRLYDRKMNPDTVSWWLRKDEKQRNSIDPAQGKGLRTVLQELGSWFQNQGTIILWGCGSDFDNVLLSNAFKATGVHYPVTYNNNRCYRTIRELFPVNLTFEGVQHTALDDARFQARVMREIINTYKFALA
jgi:exodeoxyribonuclease VIII